MTQIIEFLSMKLIISTLLVMVAMVFLAGCQTQSDDIYRQAALLGDQDFKTILNPLLKDYGNSLVDIKDVRKSRRPLVFRLPESYFMSLTRTLKKRGYEMSGGIADYIFDNTLVTITRNWLVVTGGQGDDGIFRIYELLPNLTEPLRVLYIVRRLLYENRLEEARAFMAPHIKIFPGNRPENDDTTGQVYLGDWIDRIGRKESLTLDDFYIYDIGIGSWTPRYDETPAIATECVFDCTDAAWHLKYVDGRWMVVETTTIYYEW
jgi:hypothetical protein